MGGSQGADASWTSWKEPAAVPAIWSPFTEEAALILKRCSQNASETGLQLGAEQVLCALLERSLLVRGCVAGLGVDVDALAEVLERALPLLHRRPSSTEDSILSRACKEMIEAAIELSRQDSVRRVDSGHLLLAMLTREDEPPALFLAKAGLDFSAVASWLARQRQEGCPQTL